MICDRTLNLALRLLYLFIGGFFPKLCHPNQILTRDQILNQLWEWGAEPESNVVAAQVRLLRRKLAEMGCDRAIETVYGLGYRLKGERSP